MDIAVIGLGLIGGSTLRALARQGHRTLGFDADPATRATARTAAAKVPPADRWQVAGTLPEAVAGADLVVMAVPLPAVPAVLAGLASAGHSGLITDVTSVKAPVLELVDGLTAPGGSEGGTDDRALARFVGGHPMAGRETSGFAASDPDLFKGCAWVLCLEPGLTALPDWLLLADLVTRLGARAVPTTAAEHDRAVAEISHLPHLLAAALAAGITGHPLAGTLAAGSFRDGTRVAASPADLIAAMCGGNAPAVLPALDRVRAALDQARSALDTANPEPGTANPEPGTAGTRPGTAGTTPGTAGTPSPAAGTAPGTAGTAPAIAALRAWLEPGCAARADWPPRAGEPRDLPVDTDTLLRLGRAGGWVTAVSPDHRTVTAVLPV